MDRILDHDLYDDKMAFPFPHTSPMGNFYLVHGHFLCICVHNIEGVGNLAAFDAVPSGNGLELVIGGLIFTLAHLRANSRFSIFAISCL